MTITYYGHSCFMIENEGQKLLFDPFITQNPLAKSIDIDTLKPHYILVSHGHFDHVLDLIPIAKNADAEVICSHETAKWITNEGITKSHAMNEGSRFTFPFGKVRMVHAAHSNNLPDGSFAGDPMGFVLEMGEKTIYFAGDTGISYQMKLLPELYKNIDVAILPIGGHFTMDVEDAVLAAQFIHCKNVIGMHYDSFPILEIDHQAAIDTFAKSGISLTLMGIGESQTL